MSNKNGAHAWLAHGNLPNNEKVTDYQSYKN